MERHRLVRQVLQRVGAPALLPRLAESEEAVQARRHCGPVRPGKEAEAPRAEVHLPALAARRAAGDSLDAVVRPHDDMIGPEEVLPRSDVVARETPFDRLLHGARYRSKSRRRWHRRTRERNRMRNRISNRNRENQYPDPLSIGSTAAAVGAPAFRPPAPASGSGSGGPAPMYRGSGIRAAVPAVVATGVEAPGRAPGYKEGGARLQSSPRGRSVVRSLWKRIAMFFCGLGDEASPLLAPAGEAHRALGWRHIEIRNIEGKNLTDLSDEAFDRAAGGPSRRAGSRSPASPRSSPTGRAGSTPTSSATSRRMRRAIPAWPGCGRRSSAA